MELPEYVSMAEVARVCAELGIRDWTQLSELRVREDEAELILAALDVADRDFGLDDFRQGLEVELEHGTMFEDANVTNNHPILTAKIVLAHFKESPDYYKRLDVAEIEGDLLKALVSGDAGKTASLYKKLVAARAIVSGTESAQLK
ncbi:MAG TPA: DUF5661 family protein [Acidobacteriota bacterium]|nr:DUF5661 family protein [Acidobacteriota bacterium]